MARDDEARFRITAWPAVLSAPTAVAVPEFVGYVPPEDRRGGSSLNLEPDTLLKLPLRLDNPELLTGVRRFADAFGMDPSMGIEQMQKSVSERLGGLPRDGDELTFYFDEHPMVMRPLPAEFFMREFLRLDPVSSPPGFAEFLITWGPLLVPTPLMENRDVARLRPTFPSWTLDGGRVRPSGREIGPPTAAAGEHRTEVYQELWQLFNSETEGEEKSLFGPGRPDDRVFVQATGYSVRVQYALLELYQAVFESWLIVLRDHQEIDDPTAPVPDVITESWERREWPVPKDMFDLLDTITDTVNSAAAAYGPRAEIVHPDLEQDGIAFARPMPRILTSMCLQALSFLADGVPARQCANETCGKNFTRQRGRATYGQGRSSGVLYCSASCARAQAQREYRRRRTRERARQRQPHPANPPSAGGPVGKYTALTAWLETAGPTATATFAELSALLPGGLPSSAYLHRAWWANENDDRHVQASGWGDAGYQVTAVDFATRTVTFTSGV